ncbi:ABC transporter permease [Bacillus sp. IBL03825]|uniref:ABC transporter permease n=1 Tax=Bacillus sp. IBL03825 TaxID=2953580 RepID=UPI00215797D8|nr:ABC transporter permease [Bacillus sp. IBL03825]MCR6850463.1 ABC transporter permease [Bacillus sp. IBL03825]
MDNIDFGEIPYPNEEKKGGYTNEMLNTSAKYNCVEPIELKVPFCCTVQIPRGFRLPDEINYKIGYNIDCLSVVKDHCIKNVQVDDCGPVEIDVNVLKIVGCIAMLINVQVKSDCTYHYDYHSGLSCENTVYTCCKDTICVDNVLKCSTCKLPDYCVSCDSLKVSDLNYEVKNDCGCVYIVFTGNLEFSQCLS